MTLLSSVEMQLQSLPVDVSTDAAVAKNTIFLKELAAREAPRRIIEEILVNRDLISLIASRSYQHANNFHKILLSDSRQPGGYRLSIHHWYSVRGEPAPSDEPIHNHRFSFWSHIFRGTMSASVYVESDRAGDGSALFPRYRYLPANTGNVHVCKYDGQARLSEVESVTYSSGDVYYLNYQILHRVHRPGYDQMLCTLVLRGPREREYAETYNSSYPRDGVAYNTPPMNPDQLRAILTRILTQP